MRAFTILSLSAVAAAACHNHPRPKDPSVERTFATERAGYDVETTRRAAEPIATAILSGETRSLSSKLRVVTFNVHGEPAEVVARALLADPVLRAADLVFLQEVHRVEEVGKEPCSTACGVAKRLGYHAVFAPGHAIPEGSHGVAIVSRVPITSAQVIELPYFDVHANSGRRVALAATVLVDGAPVTAYAVHLDNRVNVRDRREQMLPVLVHAETNGTPTIIAGDFNTSPFTWISHVVPVLTTTQDDRFEELLRAYGFATPVTGSGATSRFLGMRLDGIYTRGFETRSFVVRDADNISDHLALGAELRLQ